MEKFTPPSRWEAVLFDSVESLIRQEESMIRQFGLDWRKLQEVVNEGPGAPPVGPGKPIPAIPPRGEMPGPKLPDMPSFDTPLIPLEIPLPPAEFKPPKIDIPPINLPKVEVDTPKVEIDIPKPVIPKQEFMPPDKGTPVPPRLPTPTERPVIDTPNPLTPAVPKRDIQSERTVELLKEIRDQLILLNKKPALPVGGGLR